MKGQEQQELEGLYSNHLVSQLLSIAPSVLVKAARVVFLHLEQVDPAGTLRQASGVRIPLAKSPSLQV